MDTFPMMALITACFLVLLLIACSAALDSISPSEYLSDGKTLVSADGSFELGFFSPGSSRNRYVGIWYRNIPARTVVWVANRVAPVNDSSGILTVKKTGEVQIILSQNHVIWSVQLNNEAQRPKLQLLDSGNLVLVEEGNGNSGTYLWQSFDHPSDTLLPGMKLGWDLKTGFERRITAWKSSDDPSPGEFSWGIELHGNPESVMRMGSKEYFRGGPYNGQHFVGTESSRPNPVVDSRFVFNEEEAVYVFYLKNKSLISRVLVNQTDYTTQRYLWSEETQTWNLYSYMPRDYCDSYRRCGAYSYCDNTLVPPCNCLKGFQPISPTRWLSMDWSEGCRRNKPLNCKKDGFVRFKTLKLPDATHSWINKSMNLKECRTKCLHNCSCTAYTSFDVKGGGSGCAIWFGDLLDIRQFQSGGQDLYVRMSASESDLENKSRTKIALMFAIPLAVLLVVFIVCYFLYKRKRNIEEGKVLKREDCNESEVQEEDMDLPVFQLATLSHATNSFSLANKLGQGGFGPVYKGTLIDGREIAVKRLCKSSGQGLNEFKNEVKLIAKLQHRNLVRLLGCCLEGEEKLLVYEYMPKGSLDSLIFNQSGRKELNWSKRFHIICGIARGLLYLHQDSRLRIIHRDLKASNVLLDSEMNPKISDFGMAKTFGGDQTEGNTTRVVGTYGYMAPEYAIDGLFSVKSDVFSFGVLLMELVSGIKSRGLFHSDSCINLIGHAWSLWKGSKPLDLVDQLLEESCPLYEVVRCIQISLLCVQQHPEDRPTMSSVLLMLGSEVELPQPKQPGFLLENAALERDSSLGKHDSASVNNITITLLQAR